MLKFRHWYKTSASNDAGGWRRILLINSSKQQLRWLLTATCYWSSLHQSSSNKLSALTLQFLRLSTQVMRKLRRLTFRYVKVTLLWLEFTSQHLHSLLSLTTHHQSTESPAAAAAAATTSIKVSSATHHTVIIAYNHSLHSLSFLKSFYTFLVSNLFLF